MASLKRKVKTGILDLADAAGMSLARANEIRKFRDPRRKAIYETVTLSREQKQQIDSLFVPNYGEKIPYTWHRHFTAFSGSFDPAYFPELLYIPEFERFMNLETDFARVFEDKNLLPLLAAQAGVKMPETYLSCSRGILRGGDLRELSRKQAVELLYDRGEAFVKPSVDSDSGQGCFKAAFEKDTDALSGRKTEELLSSLGENFVIQKCLQCHSSIQKLYPGSVNTFRVISYRWGDRLCHIPAVMRIGRGGSQVDNAHAGGMFLAVEDDGSLGRRAFTEFKTEFTAHPDMGTVFADCRIEGFGKVLKAVERMCRVAPQMGCVNWDLTLDREGEPVLIEANVRGGSVWLSEMAHGHGPFGDKTEEILRWLRLMKKTKRSEREKYRYGRM